MRRADKMPRSAVRRGCSIRKEVIVQRRWGLWGALALCSAVVFAVTGAMAQISTPTARPATGTERLVLIEHNEQMVVDLGDPGDSDGDLRVWGPNPLFDAENAEATGASTQGTCVSLNAAFDCVAAETVIFPDGSTLEIQG